MTPRHTRAVLVGIEEYAAGPDWRLDGPALDACRFARWLLGRGVPADQIHLLVTPHHGNRGDVAACGLPVLAADRATVDRVLHETVRAGSPDELLIVHWGGHGVVEADDTRRLFYADADQANRRNLHLDAYLRALRTDYFPQRRQLILVDACQNFAAQWRGARTLPDELPPLGRQQAGRDQFALFAASPGEWARNVDARRTGAFSEAVLAELAALPEGKWPPDPAVLADAVTARFAAQRADDHSRQTPSYLWYREPHGERRLRAATPSGQPRPRLDLTAIRAVADALIAIDELLDPSVRRQLLLMLPRDIAASVPVADDARLQIVNWVRTCARFEGGRQAFLDALAMLTPAGTPEFRRAVEAIATHWPAD